MSRKPPLYPHVPKSRKAETERIWPPFQQFLNDTQKAIPDEMDAYNMYRGMATTASALGLGPWAATLEQMANDENRHHRLLEGLLQEVKEHLPKTIDLLAKTEGDPIRKFCCRLCGECAPPELLEEGRFPERMEWLRKHYSQFHRREFAEWGQGK